MAEERTLAYYAKEALDIQDACNLTGLVQGWARSAVEVKRLLEAAGIYDTDKINRHPINIMWADKLADLSRSRSTTAYGAAHDQCTRLANGEPCDPMGVATS